MESWWKHGQAFITTVLGIQEELHLLWVLGLHPRPDWLPMGTGSWEGWPCRVVPEAVWMMWIPGMLKPPCQAVVSQPEVGAACCPTFPTALAPSSKAFLDMAVVVPAKSEVQNQLSNLLGSLQIGSASSSVQMGLSGSCGTDVKTCNVNRVECLY